MTDVGIASAITIIVMIFLLYGYFRSQPLMRIRFAESVDSLIRPALSIAGNFEQTPTFHLCCLLVGPLYQCVPPRRGLGR